MPRIGGSLLGSTTSTTERLSGRWHLDYHFAMCRSTESFGSKRRPSLRLRPSTVSQCRPRFFGVKTRIPLHKKKSHPPDQMYTVAESAITEFFSWAFPGPNF